MLVIFESTLDTVSVNSNVTGKIPIITTVESNDATYFLVLMFKLTNLSFGFICYLKRESHFILSVPFYKCGSIENRINL